MTDMAMFRTYQKTEERRAPLTRMRAIEESTRAETSE